MATVRLHGDSWVMACSTNGSLKSCNRAMPCGTSQQRDTQISPRAAPLLVTSNMQLRNLLSHVEFISVTGAHPTGMGSLWGKW